MKILTFRDGAGLLAKPVKSRIIALERLRGDTSARANVERSYWERFPASVKYVEQIVLTDDAIELVKRDGVWEMPR